VPGGGDQDYNNQGGYGGGNQKPNPPFPHPAYGDSREQYRPSPYGEPPQPRQQQHAHAPHAAINGYGPSPRSHTGSPPHPPSSPGFQQQVRINGVIQGVQEHLTDRQGILVMAQRRPRVVYRFWYISEKVRLETSQLECLSRMAAGWDSIPFLGCRAIADIYQQHGFV
jgi:hypothetical protein